MDFSSAFRYTVSTMLEYNQIISGKFVVFDGDPCEVLGSHVFRKQQRKPVNQARLRNLITGKVIEHSFHQSEKADEADLGKKEVTYLYGNRGESWFCEGTDRSKRFAVQETLIGDQAKFLKDNTLIEALIFNEKIISFKLPIKVELKVTDAPPAVRGNTAQGAVKQITLETGAIINAPMFVAEGDSIRVNTQTGEYVERV